MTQIYKIKPTFLSEFASASGNTLECPIVWYLASMTEIRRWNQTLGFQI